MAFNLLSPLNKVINDTTTEILNSQLNQKLSGILTTFVTSSFKASDDVLKQIQNLTTDNSNSKPSNPNPSNP